MEPEEQTAAPEQPIVPDEPQTEEMDLTTPAEQPPVVEPAEVQPPPPQAEPGIYLCTAEIAGEHARLGVLTAGQEYDYTHADVLTLQSVAAYVELGVLEKM